MARLTTFGFIALGVGSLAVACGRAEQPLGNQPLPGVDVGAAGAGGAGREPAGTAGASETAGGDGGSSVPCEGPLKAQCLADCYDRIGVGAICQDGEYVCAPGDVAHTSCPPDTPGACHWKLPPSCYDSCESGNAVPTECVGGEPVCPNGSVTRQDCPPESCISGASCCSPNGVQTQTKCNDETHELEACPEGGHFNLGQCLPDGVTATSCADLSGQGCASPEHVCKEGCFADCVCQKDDGSSKLTWSCTFHPC